MKYSLDKNQLGLLFLRSSIGIAFIAHGLPKLLEGVGAWTWMGEQLQVIGITFAPTFFGLMAVLAEVIGGLLLLLGFLQRLSALALSFTMVIALLMHLQNGDGYNDWSHPLKMLFVFISLIFATGLPNLWQLFAQSSNNH